MNLPRPRKIWQLSQRFGKYSLVALPIIRRTKGAAHRMIDEGGPRRPDLAHDVVGRTDDQRGNAAGFDHVSDETNGLMAERSIGYQQGEIDLRLFKVIGNHGRQLVFNFLGSAHSAHDKLMMWRQCPVELCA